MNAHPVHPFRSIVDAQQSASSLLRAFRFYSLKYVESDGACSELGLQRVHSLVAMLFGYRQWSSLLHEIGCSLHAPYFDENDSVEAMCRKFTDRLAPHLAHPEADRVYRALRKSGFGCSPESRKISLQVMGLYGCDTVEQWCQLDMLARGYGYVTRYNHGRTLYDIEMLEWEYQRNVAQILGKKAPRKPRRSKRNQGR
ncbi:hypothetical protein [Burkholderia gladioli]|uniref:hypothetical protein n=1 Tax=Burkholderia gladioli TaxID=28095 RepID=UPI003D1FA3B1